VLQRCGVAQDHEIRQGVRRRVAQRPSSPRLRSMTSPRTVAVWMV
jgi:hypothetical protein